MLETLTMEEDLRLVLELELPLLLLITDMGDMQDDLPDKEDMPESE